MEPVDIKYVDLQLKRHRDLIREKIGKLILDIEKRMDGINQWKRWEFFEGEKEFCQKEIQKCINELIVSKNKLIDVRDMFDPPNPEIEEWAPETGVEVKDYISSLNKCKRE